MRSTVTVTFLIGPHTADSARWPMPTQAWIATSFILPTEREGLPASRG